MKRTLIKNYVTGIVIVMILASFGIFPITQAATNSDVEDQNIAFIENVLPLDLTKYCVTLINHYIDEGPPIAGTRGNFINRTIENFKYELDSDESTLQITIQVQNNAILSCHIYENEGQVIKDKTFNNLADATENFLEKYQDYNKEDLTDLINAIDDLDVTNNFTTTIGNNKLVISNKYIYGIELTNFEWIQLENGVGYTSLQVSYQNGDLYSIRDDRKVYTIGDTSINISSEQAIKIALEYLQSYSYEMPDHTWITDFNVTEDKITTAIETASVNYPEMRPYWYITLPLNQTYPGSVQGIAVYIWANSGEILSCSNIAYGGVEYPDDTLKDESTSTVEIDQPENHTTTPDTIIVVGLTVAIIGIVTVSATLLKKRKK